MVSKKKFIVSLLGVYVLLVALSFGALLLLARNQKSTTRSNDIFTNGFTAFHGNATSGSNTVETLVPSYAPTLGPANAKVTIVEFADFQCPFCKASVYPIRQLLAAYPNDVRLVFRHFPISDVHPLAETLANGGMCAQDQGKFWAFHDRIYAEQDGMTYDNMLVVARSVGLDVSRFQSCVDSGRFADRVKKDFGDAIAVGGRGTPTWVVNGKTIEGALPLDTWKQVITGLLK